MAKTIKPSDLGAAIQQELTLYHEKVNENCYAAGLNTVKYLVKKTKATAPKKTGDFRKNIAWKELRKSFHGFVFAWYVKSPDHRITHLLVHGHPKRNGGWVDGNPFLENALRVALPEYEAAVKEAITND